MPFISEAFAKLCRTHKSLQKKQRKGDVQTSEANNFVDHLWNKRTYKQFFTRKELNRPLVLITFLAVIQQFSGMTIIRSYVVKIFNNLGIMNFASKMFYLIPFLGTDGESGTAVRNDAYVCAIVLTFVRLFASLSLSKISQSLKRRTMYMVSALLTVFSLLLIGACIYSIQRYMISNEVIFNCQAKD